MSGCGLDGSTPVRDAGGRPVGARWFGQSCFASHALVAARNLVKVDPSLPLELLGPLGCGTQTGAASVLNALPVDAGSSFVVFGAGAVGLSAVMAAKVAGATTVIAVDLNDARLALAEELGATHIVNAANTDALGQVYAVTGGGAEYALDTTGVPSVITTAINGLRPTGTCGLVAVQQGVFIPRLIALWQQGRFPFDKLVKTFPLERINEAEKASLSGEVVKPVLVPGG
jgi:aryl-alcohol dehydrogenase